MKLSVHCDPDRAQSSVVKDNCRIRTCEQTEPQHRKVELPSDSAESARLVVKHATVKFEI